MGPIGHADVGLIGHADVAKEGGQKLMWGATPYTLTGGGSENDTRGGKCPSLPPQPLLHIHVHTSSW